MPFWGMKPGAEPLPLEVGELVLPALERNHDVLALPPPRPHRCHLATWPLGHEGVELMLRLSRSVAEPAAAIDVDAPQPLDRVVDELLREATASASCSHATTERAS